MFKLSCLDDRHSVCLLDAVWDGAEPRDTGRYSDGGSVTVVVTVESAGGSSSMEIVFDYANGIGSNSFQVASAAGCQLLFKLFCSC
jgi:hypothetical protein